MKYFFNILFLCCTLVFSQSSDFEKGEVHYNNSEWSLAKPYFLKVLVQEPSNIKAQEYLGDIAAYTKHWDEALKYYKPLVEQDDMNALYHFKYGGVLAYKAQSSNKLKALTLVGDIKKHLHRAANLDATHIEVRWALVEIYISLPGIVGGSEEKAKHYANELLSLSVVDGHLALGYVAEYNNRPKDAEYHYKKAVVIGGSEHTYSKLSGLYEKNNQPEKALLNYEKASQKLQRNHLNYLIGKVSAQYNISVDKGLEHLQRYIKNYSEKDGVPKSWANYRIAQIYRYKSDKRNAYNYIQKALEEKPDLKAAQKEKALILQMKSVE
ncbi:MAG: tetratricopeptide repeat protein [Flavobacteriaceae bacterium]